MTIASIASILPFENRVRVFDMPEIRFIGKSLRVKLQAALNPVPAFWTECIQQGYLKRMKALPQVIPGIMAIYGEYSMETNMYTYMICVACPAGTQVPDGYDNYDMRATLVAHGVTNENGADAHAGEALAAELQRQGLVRTGEGFAEFYPDIEKDITFCVLFPCGLPAVQNQ